MSSIRVIFYVLLSTRMCSVRAATSVDHFTEDNLVNRAFPMQPGNVVDLETTTLGKPQKPNSPQDSSEKLVKKAMTKETRAYIILAAVAACMGFLLIWWKAMQKVTENGNLSLPRWSSAKAGLNESLLDPSQGKTIPQEYEQPIAEQDAAAIDKTSASVYKEPSQQNEHEHLAAIEGYSAEEIMKLWEWKKVIAGERLPSANKPELSNLTFATSPVSPIIRSSKAQCGGGGGQALYGQRASPFKQMSTTESVQQTGAVKRALSADTHRKPVVGTPSVPFGSSRVISCQRTLPRVIR